MRLHFTTSEGSRVMQACASSKHSELYVSPSVPHTGLLLSRGQEGAHVGATVGGSLCGSVGLGTPSVTRMVGSGRIGMVGEGPGQFERRIAHGVFSGYIHQTQVETF